MLGNIHFMLVMSIIVIIADVTRADEDIIWGSKSAKCKKEVAKRENSKDAKVVQKDILADVGDHIVGIFVTRFPENDAIWSHKFINEHSSCKVLDAECKKKCYKEARASYSKAGASKENKPTSIQITMTSDMSEICKFGYNVEVCFEKVK